MKTPRGSPRSRRPRPSRAWLQLRKQFPQQLSDSDEAVYALTAPLIRAIELECPGLLGHDDLRFESEFRRLAGDGFFRGSKFVFPLLATYAGTATPERSYRLPTKAEILLDEGLNPAQIERALAMSRTFRAELQERRAGYAGWLVTNPEFRAEVESVRSNLADAIADWGGIPRLPLEVLGVAFGSPKREHLTLHGQLMQWYGRWNLEQLATWDLPVPTVSDPPDVTVYSPDAVASGGLMLFVPWYLLRDKTLTLAEVGAARQVEQCHPHLAEWFQRGPRGLAYERYAKMLALFVYLELALRRRYGERLAGWTDSLDRAFARFLLAEGQNTGQVTLSHVEAYVQSVRKLRQKMQRRLAGG